MYHGQGRRGQQKRRAPELLRSDHVPSSRLDKPADLERLLAGNVAGVTGIYLGSDFGVNDEHLHAIGLKLGSQLLCMELGSSDTGDGARVSCAGVQRLVAACPNMIKLKLEAVTEVDNRTFHAILSGCPNLESLTVTGHDKRSGALKGAAALKPLVDGAVPGLRRLYITDQWGVPFTAVEKLIKARGATLQVQAGQTDSDSMAHSMVLQAMGANYGDGLYGNYY